MKEKGFTLVELLAVIIILALLALITSTSVTKLVKDSKDELSATQIKLIESAAKTLAADNLNVIPKSGKCAYITLGDLKEYGLIDSKVIDASNNQEISDDLKIKLVTTTNSHGNPVTTYEVNSSDVSTCLHSLYKKYENGEVVYFDVSTGKVCKESQYHENNSLTGYNGISSNASNQTGCLKFYAFNDNTENKNVDLLLDHNTTDVVTWNSSGISKDGPKEVLTHLKADTKDWKGTITPQNYTMNQSGSTSDANYTIDYSDYKARLITANEIAQIIGKTGWNESTATETFYFNTSSSTCTVIDADEDIETIDPDTVDFSGCNYKWLYDRTSTICTDYGCLNDSHIYTNGYWTSSSYADHVGVAWLVPYQAYLGGTYVDAEKMGVRPVIEVSKSNLS